MVNKCAEAFSQRRCLNVFGGYFWLTILVSSRLLLNITTLYRLLDCKMRVFFHTPKGTSFVLSLKFLTTRSLNSTVLTMVGSLKTFWHYH